MNSIIQLEPTNYLNDDHWGTFSILKRYKNGQYAHQKNYKLSELATVVESLADVPDHDIWISQASFFAYNRRKVNLASVGLCWVDVDYYRVSQWLDISPVDFLYEYILPLCDKHRFYYPSLALDSGRGLQLKWFFENLPAKALPRWNRLQTEICNLLAKLGSDANAKDASRVLRLENTINQKTGRRVKVCWVNVDENLKVERYVFNDLCNAILPFTQEELRAKREKAATSRLRGTRFNYKASGEGEIISLLSGRNRSLETLNWCRLKDLQLLIQLRGGDIGDGLREALAMYLCNFYALRQAASGIPEMDVWLEFIQLCKQAAPHWDYNKIRAKTNNIFQLFKRARAGETVTFNGREYPVLYTPKNQTLIDLFEITPEEEKQLSTIISSTEYKARHRRRDESRRRAKGGIDKVEYTEQRKAQSDVKAEQAKVYLKQGKTKTWIAKQLGITRQMVHKYLTQEKV